MKCVTKAVFILWFLCGINFSAYAELVRFFETNCKVGSMVSAESVIDDDDILYSSGGVYNQITNNIGKSVSEIGVFECNYFGFRNTDCNCKTDALVVLGPGHIFSGNTINSTKLYRCASGVAVGDVWQELGFDRLPACNNSLLDKNASNVDLMLKYAKESKGVKIKDLEAGSYITSGEIDGLCIQYVCKDGYTEENGKCVKSSVETSDNEKTKSENQTNNGNNDSAETTPVLGDACAKSDLPQYATSGIYVNNGVSIVCAATSCQSGTYLVVNSSGIVQGWCVASTYCKDGTKLNIINGTQTDLQCLSQYQNQEETAAITETESSEQQTVDNRSECERGIAGYVFFEGVCMPEYQKNQIEQQRKAKELTGLKSSIDVYADKIAQIEAAHSGDKVTVWKNEEGKFNTSRLLSDSLAGVALGTVGGLVVNKVVKNNDIETGFDEIGCAIDGEKIANFDDTFVISGAVDKNGCVGNNYGYSNVYVWASRYADGADYSRMVEDVANPDNNACWVRVDIESDNAKIHVSDIPSRWFMVGQQITCGNWTNRDVLRQRALDARKSARTWATVGGAVGGAGVGVGVMELFGNRLIGGKVMGQKALNEAELLYSQMSEGEREEYRNSSEQIEALCNELHAKGGTHAACGD